MNVDLPVAPEQAAPRSTVSRSGGGAPRPLVAETFDRLRNALEALEGRTVGEVTPYLEDLEHAAGGLEAVVAHLGGDATTPAPKPAPRHDTAVAEATGVLADPPRDRLGVIGAHPA